MPTLREDIHQPEVLRRIAQLQAEGKGFNEIRKILLNEFKIEMSAENIKNVALTYTIRKPWATEARDNIVEQMKEEYVKTLKEIKNQNEILIKELQNSDLNIKIRIESIHLLMLRQDQLQAHIEKWGREVEARLDFIEMNRYISQILPELEQEGIIKIMKRGTNLLWNQ